MKYFYISIICIFIGASGFFLWPVFFPENKIEKLNFSMENLVPFADWQSKQVVIAEEKQKVEDENKSVTLLAVGDVMLSRVVGEKMVAKKNYFYPFEKLAEVLNSTDLTFGNLESPIIAGLPVKTGSFSFRADEVVGESLSKAGFDIVSLANNHILNQGQKGIAKTVEVLEKNKIDFCGLAGINLTSKIIEKNGLKLVFLCYSYDGFAVLQNNYGVNGLDIEKMKKDIEEIRTQVDFVVISMHAGTEYAHTSGEVQQKFAHAGIDAGADLIIGHHPHVVQEMEKYKDKFIFYSLGNFIFDQMWSEDTRQGAAIKINFTKNKLPQVLEYIPLYISDYSQPDLAVGAVKEAVFKDLGILATEQ
ncbi:MAG: CapA family protein [Patescibacteria group bacterium]